MVADPPRLFMSAEEYLELDRNSLDARYEFIDGVVTMLASGTADPTCFCCQGSVSTCWREALLP